MISATFLPTLPNFTANFVESLVATFVEIIEPPHSAPSRTNYTQPEIRYRIPSLTGRKKIAHRFIGGCQEQGEISPVRDEKKIRCWPYILE
jgi:hypothetical protein